MESFKSYTFVTYPTKQKYIILYNKAICIRDLKNKISYDIFNNFFGEELSTYKLSKTYRAWYDKNILNSHDYDKALQGVVEDYNILFKKIKKAAVVKVQKIIDFKSKTITSKTTKLSMAISFCVRYYNKSFLQFITNTNDTKNEAYSNFIHYYNKYGNRIIELSKNIQKRKCIIVEPIKYTSINFTSCNQLSKPLLQLNKKRHGKFNIVFVLGAQKTNNGKLLLFSKFNQTFHGDIEDFNYSKNKANEYICNYTLCFEKEIIKVILTKRITIKPPVLNKTRYVGVDINIKHNLFSLSNGDTIDYDREILNKTLSILKHLDINQKNFIKNNNKNRNYKTNKHKKIIKNNSIVLENMLNKKCNDLVKWCISNNKDHIVLEDLQKATKTFASIRNIKISRIYEILDLKNIKHKIKRIANKHNLQVTFVHPEYTSQSCKCGNITKNNRLKQEIFICTKCGDTMNADTHAAQMIEDRMSNAVLREKLLSHTSNGYIAKYIKPINILEVLYDTYTKINGDVLEI